MDVAGLLNDRLIVAHCVHLHDKDVALLAERRVNVVHCPKSNLKLGSGICPVTKLLAAGVNIALGTDSSGSNNSLNMFSEMQFASLLAKGTCLDAAALDCFAVVEMATINGAKALGVEDDLGSLEAGKLCDMVSVDLSALELAPVHNPVSTMVYTGAHSVSHVWINGELKVKDNQVLCMDIDRSRIANYIQKVMETRRKHIEGLDKVPCAPNHPDILAE